MHRKSVYPVFATALLLFAVLTVGTSHLSRAAENDLRIATFAGGCFWCVEADFDNVPGVVRTVSGYTGGSLKNPTYRLISAGGTGHREAVQIFYDPKKVTYAMLLDVLWRSVDPTDGGGQFCDRGESYGTAIFANSPDQKRLAEDSKRKLQASGVLKQPIVTPIEVAGPFYPAEGYHQDYYKKNPIRYKIYRYGCGRDARIKELWGKDAHLGIAKH
jgi:methionine-S-sulfoxide reductase